MRIPDKIAVSIPKSYAGIMFYITWFMYSFVYSILSSEYSTLVNLSKLNRITQYFIILGLGSCYFLSNEIIKKKNVRLLVFLVTIFLISVKNINLNFLAMIMFIVVAQNIDLEKFLKTDLAFRIFMFIFIVLSCAVGIIDNYKAEINGNLKMSFGFGHPNVYCFYLFTILLEYMYVNFYKLRRSNMGIYNAYIWICIYHGSGKNKLYFVCHGISALYCRKEEAQTYMQQIQRIYGHMCICCHCSPELCKRAALHEKPRKNGKIQ